MKPSKYLINLSNYWKLSPQARSTFENLSIKLNNSNNFKIIIDNSENGFSNLEIANFFSNLNLKSDQIITPSQHFFKKIRNYSENKKLVLLGGNEKIIPKLAFDNKINYYLSFEEYFKLFPDLVPIARILNAFTLETKKKIIERNNWLTENDFNYPLQINEIYYLSVPSRWEEHCQVVCDLLSSENGVIAKNFNCADEKKHIQINFSNSELLLDDEFSLGMGSFKEAIKACYHLIYKKNIVFNENDDEGEKTILDQSGSMIYIYIFYNYFIVDWTNEKENIYYFDFRITNIFKEAKSREWRSYLIK